MSVSARLLRPEIDLGFIKMPVLKRTYRKFLQVRAMQTLFAYMRFSLGRGRKLAQTAQAYFPSLPNLLIGGNNQPPIEVIRL